MEKVFELSIYEDEGRYIKWFTASSREKAVELTTELYNRVQLANTVLCRMHVLLDRYLERFKIIDESQRYKCELFGKPMPMTTDYESYYKSLGYKIFQAIQNKHIKFNCRYTQEYSLDELINEIRSVEIDVL